MTAQINDITGIHFSQCISVMRLLEGTLGGYTIKYLLKTCASTVVVATGCGLCFRQYKPDTELLKKHLRYAATSSVVVGIPLAVIAARAHPILLPVTIAGNVASVAGYSFTFFCVRSQLASLELVYPGSRHLEVSGVMLTAVASTASMATMACWKHEPIRRTLPIGFFLGILGHAVYLFMTERRMRYILSKEHPELVREMYATENYMEDQSLNNPEYTGPVMPKHPVVQWCEGYMEGLGAVKDNFMNQTLDYLNNR